MGDGAVGVAACPGVMGVQFIESPAFEEGEKGHSRVLSAKSDWVLVEQNNSERT